MVNKMKNEYLCWIVDNYAVCNPAVFLQVVGKVHVSPLILIFFETDPISSCLCVARVSASS